MGLNRLAEWLGAPLFIIAQSAPLAALIPILTFAYGIVLMSKVMTVCIMAMPVIVLNSLTAVRHTPVSLLDMGRALLRSAWQVFRNIVPPSPAPVILVRLRSGCDSRSTTGQTQGRKRGWETVHIEMVAGEM